MNTTSCPHELIPVPTSSTTTTSSSGESLNVFMQQTIEYPVDPISPPPTSSVASSSNKKLGTIGFNMTNQYRKSSSSSSTAHTLDDNVSKQHFNLTGIKPSSKSLSSVTSSSVNSSACAYMGTSFTSPNTKCYPNNTISYDYYLQHESPHLIPLSHRDVLPIVTHHTSKILNLNKCKDNLSDSSSLNVCNSSSSLGSIVEDDITIKASNHKVPLYVSPPFIRMKGTLPPIADDVFEKDCKISFDEDVQVFIPSSKSSQGSHNQRLAIYDDTTTIQQKNVFQKSSERVKSILCISNQNSTTNGQKSQIDPFKPSSSSTQSPIRAPQSSNEDKLNQTLTPKRSGKQKSNIQSHNKNILLEDSQENILVGLPLRISDENNVNGVPQTAKTTRNFVRKLHQNRKLKQYIENRKELSTIHPNHKSTTITSKMNSSSTDTMTKKSKNSTFKRKSNKQELENKWIDDAARKILPIIQKLNDKETTLPNDLADDSVRGRFDGMDLISLGSARQLSYLRSDQKRLAGQRYTLRSMVTDMLWSSCGQDPPEIIFEGYTEIGEDRWGVQVVKQAEKNNTSGYGSLSKPAVDAERNGKHSKSERSISWKRISKGLKTSDYDDGSNFLSFYKDDDDDANNDTLFHCIHEHNEEIEVTSNSVQCNVSSFSNDMISFETDVQTTCPVDADDDIFLFNNMAQLNHIYDEAGSFLKEASMTDAVYMFDKIVRSMQARFSSNRNQHLLGSAYHNLGIVQMWAGLYEDALKSFDHAILVRRECLNPNHATIAVSLAKIGIVFFAIERLDYALKAFQKALVVRQQISSRDHLEIAKMYNNIAAVYYQKGDNKNAMDYFVDAFKIQERCLRGRIKRAPLVYDSSMTLGNMGKVFLSVGEYDMARVVFKEALKLQTSTFSNDHNIILPTLGNLAYTETKNEKLADALQLHKQILQKQIQKFGASNREVAETKGLMGVLYIQLEDFKSATKCLDDVLSWQMSNLDDHHPAIKNTIQMLDRLKSDPRGIS